MWQNYMHEKVYECCSLAEEILERFHVGIGRLFRGIKVRVEIQVFGILDCECLWLINESVEGLRRFIRSKERHLMLIIMVAT